MYTTQQVQAIVAKANIPESAKAWCCEVYAINVACSAATNNTNPDWFVDNKAALGYAYDDDFEKYMELCGEQFSGMTWSMLFTV
jgi:hypothetical protein